MADIDKYRDKNKADAKIEAKRRKNAARRAVAARKAEAEAQRAGAGSSDAGRGGSAQQAAAGSSDAGRDGSTQQPAAGSSGTGKRSSTRRTAAGSSGTGRGGRRKTRRRINRTALVMYGVIALLFLVTILRIAAYVGSISRYHLTDEGLTHNERFSNAVVVHGIDVSEHQKKINWKKVKSGEADFAFIRAGYRSVKEGELHEDAMFRKNMKAARKAGVMKGAYFYSQALNTQEAEEEAEYLLELVKSYDVEMPLAIDFEIYEGGRLDKAIQSGEMAYASAYHDIVLAFCDKVEKAGYESCVYANYDMLENYMDSSILDDEVTIWVAQYSGSCSLESDYRYWQCAENAVISGINGNVDHDIWYIEPGRVYPTRASGSEAQTSIGECKVKFDKESYKLRSHRAKPGVTVTAKDGTELRKGKQYEISYVKNTVKGTGYAVIRGTGKYKDWMAVPFTIK